MQWVTKALNAAWLLTWSLWTVGVPCGQSATQNEIIHHASVMSLKWTAYYLWHRFCLICEVLSLWQWRLAEIIMGSTVDKNRLWRTIINYARFVKGGKNRKLCLFMSLEGGLQVTWLICQINCVGSIFSSTNGYSGNWAKLILTDVRELGN